MTAIQLTENQLRQFTGTEQYYTHPLYPFKYTDGVRFLAQTGQAYWLLDAIASRQGDPLIKNDPMLADFQLWQLDVSDHRSAVLSCYRDTNDLAIAQTIDYTDFPFSLKLYLEYARHQGGILLLPSER